MSLIANHMTVNIPYLKVPQGYGYEGNNMRDAWTVQLIGGNPIGSVFAAFIPSVFLSLLVFFELHASTFCVNRREHLLKRGHGYHLDLLAQSAGILASSLLGVPFCLGSGVLSVNNVQSLKIDDEDEAKKAFVGIREQRLSCLLAYLLVGVSPLLSDILKYIPVPVLYGLLIYTAIRSLHNVQFTQRLLMMFMPRGNRPEVVYLRQVTLNSANTFTMVQLVCVSFLSVVRATVVAPFFPILLCLLFVVRFLLEKILTTHYIHILDEQLVKLNLLRVSVKPTAAKHMLGASGSDQATEEHISIDLSNSHSNGEITLDETQQEDADINFDDNEDDPILHKPCTQLMIGAELAKLPIWKRISKQQNRCGGGNSRSNSSQRGSPSNHLEEESRKRRRKKSKTATAPPTIITCSHKPKRMKKKHSIDSSVIESDSNRSEIEDEDIYADNDTMSEAENKNTVS